MWSKKEIMRVYLKYRVNGNNEFIYCVSNKIILEHRNSNAYIKEIKSDQQNLAAFALRTGDTYKYIIVINNEIVRV